MQKAGLKSAPAYLQFQEKKGYLLIGKLIAHFDMVDQIFGSYSVPQAKLTGTSISPKLFHHCSIPED